MHTAPANSRMCLVCLFTFFTLGVLPFGSVLAGGEILACLNEKGNLRVVAAAAECKKNETPLSWNTQGPQGETGAQGPQGEPGPQGPTGPQGPSGAHFDIYDANDQYLGVMIDQGPLEGGEGGRGYSFMYHPEVNVFYALDMAKGDLDHVNIRFDLPSCSNTANMYTISDHDNIHPSLATTRYVVKGGSGRFFMPIRLVKGETINVGSVLYATYCASSTAVIQTSDSLSAVEVTEVLNPLPVTFPVAVPFRYEYVGP